MCSTLKNYSSIIAFIGILTFIIVPLYQHDTSEKDYLDIVSKSFQVTKAEFYELNIEAWAQIKKKGISSGELQALYNELAGKLSLKTRKITLNEYEDFISLYCQEVLEGDVYLQLSLQSSLSEGLESGTYLGIQISSDDLEKGRSYYDLVKETFDALNIKTDIGITLTGTYPNKLREKELYQISDLVFTTLNAQVLEGITTEELISLSGYTSECNDYLVVEDKKINLNLASRYHEIDNTTYIHIGAPLIFQEY